MLTPLNMLEHLLFKCNIKNPSSPVFCQVLLPHHGAPSGFSWRLKIGHIWGIFKTEDLKIQILTFEDLKTVLFCHIQAFSFTNAWNEHVWCWSVMLKCDSWTSVIPASLLVTAFALCFAAISSTICQNIWLYSVLPYRIGDVPVVSGREKYKTTHIWYMK